MYIYSERERERERERARERAREIESMCSGGVPKNISVTQTRTGWEPVALLRAATENHCCFD